MFSSTKSDPNPLGVPLDDLQATLEASSFKATLRGNILTAHNERCAVRIEVVPPESLDSQDDPIRAVVRMRAALPTQLFSLFQGKEAEFTTMLNPFAALGSLCVDRASVFIGSRLTIYEAEDTWEELHLPLLMFATACASDAILGALRRMMAKEEKRRGASEWTERDLAQVFGYLSRLCFCNADGLGLTAEFGLSDGAVSAIAGDHQTALFQLRADEPHTELGGGLFCLLEMPHQLRGIERLKQVCIQLNNMEMAAHDLPPHFGAWCPGSIGTNPAYVSFLPNDMHMMSGIAVNFAVWAMNRAQWANRTLASLVD